MSKVQQKATILVVDDALDNIRILIEILKDEYAVIPATSGEDALEKLTLMDIDLVLLDIMMGKMDGYDTCQAIRAIPEIAAVPIIFISSLSEELDNARGFVVGGDDYICKPFQPSFVKARIKHQLSLVKVINDLEELAQQGNDCNPLSRLPGRNTTRSLLERLVREPSTMAIVCVNLDNFKPFNDKYGYHAGDKILQFTAAILQHVLTTLESKHSFLGHFEGDDFVMLMPADSLERVTDNIILRFDEGIGQFYQRDDCTRGYIVSTNRCGEMKKHPLITIKMAGIDLFGKQFAHYLTLLDTCLALREKNAEQAGSSFVAYQGE